MLIMVGGVQVSMSQDNQTYNRVRMGGGIWLPLKKEMVPCNRCRVDITKESVKRHLDMVYGLKESRDDQQ